jgi:hypothetical protein
VLLLLLLLRHLLLQLLLQSSLQLLLLLKVLLLLRLLLLLLLLGLRRARPWLLAGQWPVQHELSHGHSPRLQRPRRPVRAAHDLRKRACTSCARLAHRRGRRGCQ